MKRRKITSLEELITIKNQFKVEYGEGIKDIGEEFIVGGDEVNSVVNRVFTYRFNEVYLEEIVRIFRKLKGREIHEGRIYTLIYALRSIAREMKNNNNYALEAILYGSKEINNNISNNEILVDKLGGLIKEIYMTSEQKYKSALEYILETWKWTPQLNIVINACGKIKDEELLRIIYYNLEEETKVEGFKAFVNSGMTSSIEYIMKIMAEVQEGDINSNKICRYLSNYYINNFGESGIELALEYVKTPSMSRRGKKELYKILPKSEGNDIGAMIKMVQEDKLNELNKFLSSSGTRRNLYVALRWSKNPKAESIALNGLKNYKNSSTEIGEALITLAKLRSNEVISLSHNYISKNIAKTHCYGALAIKGFVDYGRKLAEEFFEEPNRRNYCIIKQCRGILGKLIREIFEEYVSSHDSSKIIKGLNGGKELVIQDEIQYGSMFIEELRKMVRNNSGNTVLTGEEVRLHIIRVIDEIFNEKTKQKLIPVLFNIIESENSSTREKVRAKAILLKVGAAVPN